MLWLTGGGKLLVLPKGEPLGDSSRFVELESPVWRNFRFFTRIKATPVRRTEHIKFDDDCPDIWKFEREVEFFHRGKRIAVVALVGQLVCQKNYVQDKHTDNTTAWKISKIGYFKSDGIGGGFDPLKKDWVEVELVVARYSWQSILK